MYKSLRTLYRPWDKDIGKHTFDMPPVKSAKEMSDLCLIN